MLLPVTPIRLAVVYYRGVARTSLPAKRIIEYREILFVPPVVEKSELDVLFDTVGMVYIQGKGQHFFFYIVLPHLFVLIVLQH